MPELPEVESYTRYFRRHALEQPIARVEVRDARILGEVRPDALARRLRGRSFTEARRHGKHLFANAGTAWLRLHFGMTGDLAYYRDAAEEPRFARVVFDFKNGSHLAFDDMRLFGVVDLVADPDSYIAAHHLGPDPLDASFGLRDFRARLAERRGAIKALLMSQELVAGLGNLYVDETLFQTGISPRRTVDRLSDGEAKALLVTMRRIVRHMIDGKPRRGWLFDRREKGEPCPKCGAPLRRETIAGRTTVWCGRHQR